MRITLSLVALTAALPACGPSPALREPEPPAAVEVPAAEAVQQGASPPLRQREGFRPYQAGGRLSEGTVYEGHYLCAQGETEMTLQIQQVQGRHVGGVFEFFHEPSSTRGSFSVEGDLKADGEIIFEPVEWIVHPPRYIAVPFRLNVSEDGDRVQGGVMHASCGAMDARRRR